MEIPQLKIKCECGRDLSALDKFCSGCGRQAVRMRSENEIKIMRKRMEGIIRESMMSGNLFACALMCQTDLVLRWMLGEERDPVAATEAAIKLAKGE